MGEKAKARGRIDRRGFLRAAPSAAVAAAACRHGGGDARPADAGDLSDWAAVRASFELDSAYIHLAQLLLASHPRPVREAIERYRQALDRNPVAMFFENEEKLENAARAAAAAYCGAEPDELALTGNTTTGVALIYGGLRLREGQEVLTTTHDHYVTYESLRLRAQRTGAAVRKVALYDEPAQASADEIVARLRAAVRPETRVVGVTWVHSSTGVKLPIRLMADAIAALNAGRDEGDRILFAVDGVHGFGVERETPVALGCDFFAAGCHKWILGPRGTGLLWGRREAWTQHEGLIPTFEWKAFEAWMRGEPVESAAGPGPLASPGGFHAFEHRWALPAAFAFHERIGRARITARIHALARQCKEGLARMPHVTLHTPMDASLSAGLVCFEVAGKRALEVVMRLYEKKVIGSPTPYATSYARLTPGLHNTPDEIERALAEVRALA